MPAIPRHSIPTNFGGCVRGLAYPGCPAPKKVMFRCGQSKTNDNLHNAALVDGFTLSYSGSVGALRLNAPNHINAQRKRYANELASPHNLQMKLDSEIYSVGSN
jgi:hypothetical protein